MFSFENEKRALSTYYVLFRSQLSNFHHSLPDLRTMQGTLESELKDLLAQPKSSPRMIETTVRKLHIVKSVIGTLELMHVHMKAAMLKLGVLMYTRMEDQRAKLAGA